MQMCGVHFSEWLEWVFQLSRPVVGMHKELIPLPDFANIQLRRGSAPAKKDSDTGILVTPILKRPRTVW